jgi:hypothetical protein
MAYGEPEDADVNESRVTSVRKRWKEAKDGNASWRTEARMCYDFVAGEQWEQSDKDKLNEEGRPPVTFNRTAPMIDAVSGLEINNRQTIRYYPREIGDVKPNEILTATADWIRDQCDAEDEESEAFRDASICGVGCTETRMDYEEEADGKVIDERRDPLMVFPDPSSKKRSYKDARYVFHAEWVDKTEIESRWPDKEVAWSDDDLGSQTPGDGDRSFLYDGDNPDVDVHKDKGLVLHYQCWKKEPYYRLFDPFQQKNVELSEEEFEKLKENGSKLGMTFNRADVAGEKDISYVKQFKKVYYRGFFCGSTELEYSRSPIQTGFTFKFITAKRDRNKACWYGIVRVLIDPQKWANKWLSQVLHIVNSNAKGGAFVEEGALVDKRKAQDEWAKPSPLILLTEGSIEKIKERTPSAYPTGLDRLMMFAFDSLPYVTGINLEMLGMANREQAGVLEQQRKKSAMAILAPLFASAREFKKEKGRLYLEFIEKFIPEGRIVRVVGQGKAQYVPFTKQPGVSTYDVVVDESPDSPDFRSEVWTSIREILPAVIKQGGAIPPEVLKYAPMPSEAADALAGAMSPQIPPEIQQKMEQMQQMLQKAGDEVKKLSEENLNLKLDKSVEMAKVNAKVAGDERKIAQKMTSEMAQGKLAEMQALVDAATEKFKAELKADTERRNAALDAMVTLKTAVLKASSDIAKEKEKAKSDKEKGKKLKTPKGVYELKAGKIKTPSGKILEITED